MTTIRTSCQRCGDVELTPDDLRLELSPATGEGSYLFACPFCGATQRRPASHRVVSILLATGVAYDVADDVAPITEHEIDEFRSAIERDDFIARLTA
jgi:hypothetical protein